MTQGPLDKQMSALPRRCSCQLQMLFGRGAYQRGFWFALPELLQALAWLDLQDLGEIGDRIVAGIIGRDFVLAFRQQIAQMTPADGAASDDRDSHAD